MKSMKSYPLRIICLALILILFTNNEIISQIIRGNGEVVTLEREISAFRGIIATGGFELYLEQGDSYKVVVEADENLHNYIITEVRNEMLDVKVEADVRKAQALKVFVTLVDFNHLIAIGAVNIKSDVAINLDQLQVFVSGISAIKMIVSAKELEIEVTDRAYAHLTGNADIFNFRVNDEAELDAFDLIANKCDAKVSGVCVVRIYALDELKMRVTGASNLYYKGDPLITDRISSGSGFIIKRKLSKSDIVKLAEEKIEDPATEIKEPDKEAITEKKDVAPEVVEVVKEVIVEKEVEVIKYVDRVVEKEVLRIDTLRIHDTIELLRVDTILQIDTVDLAIIDSEKTNENTKRSQPHFLKNFIYLLLLSIIAAIIFCRIFNATKKNNSE